MTIREIEALSGMTRANIRFYESEGLLTPNRMENGYRDYTRSDLDTLHKIRLLRALGLGIDEIRKLSAGETALGEALESRLSAMQEEQRTLVRAEEVARAMLRAHADYAPLDRALSCGAGSRRADSRAAGRAAEAACALAAVFRADDRSASVRSDVDGNPDVCRSVRGGKSRRDAVKRFSGTSDHAPARAAAAEKNRNDAWQVAARPVSPEPQRREAALLRGAGPDGAAHLARLWRGDPHLLLGAPV